LSYQRERAGMSIQATNRSHVGRMSLLQSRWNLKAVGVIGNRWTVSLFGK
jgi:hypothetical protein